MLTRRQCASLTGGSLADGSHHCHCRCDGCHLPSPCHTRPAASSRSRDLRQWRERREMSGRRVAGVDDSGVRTPPPPRVASTPAPAGCGSSALRELLRGQVPEDEMFTSKLACYTHCHYRGGGRTTAPNPLLGHSYVARRQVTACVIALRTGPSLLGSASWNVKLPERAAVDRR